MHCAEVQARETHLTPGQSERSLSEQAHPHKREADVISVGDVINAVDESVDATRCQRSNTGCQSGMRCLTHTLWSDLSARIEEFLNNITLAELVEKSDVKAVALRQENSVNDAIKQLENIQVSCQL